MTSLSRRLSQLLIGLYLMMLVVTPMTFSFVNDELFEFPKMLVVYSFASLIAASWLSKCLLDRKVYFQRTWLDWPHLAFLLGQAVATLFSLNMHTSLFGFYTRFNGGLMSTITYLVLFYAFVTFFKPAHIKKLLLTLVISLLITSLYAFPEHFGISPSCYLLNGEWTVSCWKQDVQTRVFGTVGQPNWLAALIITLIPLTAALSLHTPRQQPNWKSKLILQWLPLLTLAIGTTTLLFTRSRSGLLGGFAGLTLLGLSVFWIYWLQPKLSRKKANSKPKLPALPTALAVAAVAVPMIVFGTPFTPSLSELLKPASNSVPATPAPTPSGTALQVGGSESGEIRKIVWSGAIDIWKRYPIFGSGVETFAYSYYLDRPAAHNHVSEWNFLYNKAHNEILNYLATTGAVGLLTYLVLILFPLGQVGWMLVAPRSSLSAQDKRIASGLASGLVALHISNFFGFSTVSVNVLMFTFHGLIQLLFLQSLDQKLLPTNPKKPQPAVSSEQWLGILLVWLFSLGIIAQVYKTWRADILYARGQAMVRSASWVEGLKTLETAHHLAPNEATYTNPLALYYGQAVLTLAQSGQATPAAEFAEKAVEYSMETLELNDASVIFVRNQAQVYTSLGRLNPEYYRQAESLLEQAIKMAPTDPAGHYQLALLYADQQKIDQSREQLQRAVELKPNYEIAAMALATLEEQTGNQDAALRWYQFVLEKSNPDNIIALERIASLSGEASN